MQYSHCSTYSVNRGNNASLTILHHEGTMCLLSLVLGEHSLETQFSSSSSRNEWVTICSVVVEVDSAGEGFVKLGISRIQQIGSLSRQELWGTHPQACYIQGFHSFRIYCSIRSYRTHQMSLLEVSTNVIARKRTIRLCWWYGYSCIP